MKWLDSVRGNRVCISFHLGALTHHLFVSYYINYQAGLENYVHTDMQIKIMVEYSMWYLTCWNIIMQLCYFSMSLAHDFLHLSDSHVLQVAKNNIEYLRNYVFRVFAFPLATTVSAKFWALCLLDRTFVFSPKVEDLVPAWCNHAVHTNIVPILIIEIIITYHCYSPHRSQWKEICAMTSLSMFYMFCFFGIYFLHGIWLYPVYTIMTWTQRISVLTVAYFFCLAMYKCGEFISNKLWEHKMKLNQKSQNTRKKIK